MKKLPTVFFIVSVLLAIQVHFASDPLAKRSDLIMSQTKIGILKNTDLYVHDMAKGVVKERMELMKSYAGGMKKINNAIRNSSADDVEVIKTEAAKMVMTSEKIMNMFPVGSSGGISEASPQIWIQNDDFLKQIKKFAKAARKLFRSATSLSKEDSFKLFREVGRACKTCHQSYRNIKQRH